MPIPQRGPPNARPTPPLPLIYKSQTLEEVHGWYESSLACSWAIFAFASSNSTVLALASASVLYSLWVRSSANSSKPAATLAGVGEEVPLNACLLFYTLRD